MRTSILLAVFMALTTFPAVQADSSSKSTYVFESWTGRLSEAGNAEAVLQKLEEMGESGIGACISVSHGGHNYVYLSGRSPNGKKVDWKYKRWEGRISENAPKIRDFIDAIGKRSNGAKLVEELGGTNYAYLFYLEE